MGALVETRCVVTAHPTSQRLPVAILLIDVINPMDFPGAGALVSAAKRAAQNIARLKRRARDAGIPVVYVNDNFDCWHLGFRELVDKFPTAKFRVSR
jgi:nicotinamidase-related amidase